MLSFPKAKTCIKQ